MKKMKKNAQKDAKRAKKVILSLEIDFFYIGCPF
jgi:hypothetical protein